MEKIVGCSYGFDYLYFTGENMHLRRRRQELGSLEGCFGAL